MSDISLTQAQVDALIALAAVNKSGWVAKDECLPDGQTTVHKMTLYALEKRKLISLKDSNKGTSAKILKRGLKAIEGHN